jgi:hypothetical protein
VSSADLQFFSYYLAKSSRRLPFRTLLIFHGPVRMFAATLGHSDLRQPVRDSRETSAAGGTFDFRCHEQECTVRPSAASIPGVGNPAPAAARRLLCGLALAVMVAAPARAEITITRAEYAAGVLVVRGETSEPGQRVTLDGRYRTRTDRFKEFRFRIRYLPRDCTVSIRAGREVRPAVVANCDRRL